MLIGMPELYANFVSGSISREASPLLFQLSLEVLYAIASYPDFAPGRDPPL